MLLPPPMTVPLAELWSIVGLPDVAFLELPVDPTKPPARLKAPTVTLPTALELVMTPKPKFESFTAECVLGPSIFRLGPLIFRPASRLYPSPWMQPPQL